MKSTVTLLPMQIMHFLMECQSSVLFSHTTGQIFEVTTNTKIKDLVQTIANKLMLSSADGFSLFVKTPDKVCTHTMNMLPWQYSGS